MKANVATREANAAVPGKRNGAARTYFAGQFPVRVPVTPELGEEIERLTEWYRLTTRREQTAFIKRLCRQIVAAFKPDKIILFGSRAYGKPRADSDIDLLVVMPYEGSSRAQAVRISNHLQTLTPIDLLVRTAEEIRERIRIGDQFIREIVARGKILYEADHAGIDC